MTTTQTALTERCYCCGQPALPPEPDPEGYEGYPTPPQCQKCTDAENAMYKQQEAYYKRRHWFPVTKSLRIACLYARIKRHQKNVEDFHNDPMTECCPCVSDFSEDFDRSLRHLAAELDRAGQDENDNQAT